MSRTWDALRLKAVKKARSNPVVGLPRLAAILRTKDGTEYVGFNSRKTHPLAKEFGRKQETICLHAEVDAIRQALRDSRDPSGGYMYVARVLKNGQPALAKPCEGCQRALVAFDIQNVRWST